MLSKLARVAFGLFLLTRCVAQNATETPDDPRYYSEIPEEEKAALASIIEDDPNDVMRIAKDWESPEYSLIYRTPLPIPPVKEPKMCVSHTRLLGS